MPADRLSHISCSSQSPCLACAGEVPSKPSQQRKAAPLLDGASHASVEQKPSIIRSILHLPQKPSALQRRQSIAASIAPSDMQVRFKVRLSASVCRQNAFITAQSMLDQAPWSPGQLLVIKPHCSKATAHFGSFTVHNTGAQKASWPSVTLPENGRVTEG